LRTRKSIHREKVWQAMTSTALFGRLRTERGSKRSCDRWQPLTTQVPHGGDGTWALNRTPTCTGPGSGPFRVRIEAGQCGWRRARISRKISTDANQFISMELATPRSERHRENKRGSDMEDDWGDGLGRPNSWSSFLGHPGAKFFSKNGLAEKNHKPNPSTKGRSSTELRCASSPARL
jgi:hypothetical protein